MAARRERRVLIPVPVFAEIGMMSVVVKPVVAVGFSALDSNSDGIPSISTAFQSTPL